MLLRLVDLVNVIDRAQMEQTPVNYGVEEVLLIDPFFFELEMVGLDYVMH